MHREEGSFKARARLKNKWERGGKEGPLVNQQQTRSLQNQNVSRSVWERNKKEKKKQNIKWGGNTFLEQLTLKKTLTKGKKNC